MVPHITKKSSVCEAVMLLSWLFVFHAGSAMAMQASADVVVLVDTSTSMVQPGMDPERTSLLVTKLFADIVPGNLAVGR